MSSFQTDEMLAEIIIVLYDILGSGESVSPVDAARRVRDLVTQLRDTVQFHYRRWQEADQRAIAAMSRIDELENTITDLEMQLSARK